MEVLPITNTNYQEANFLNVKIVDRSKWKKKGIVKLLLADGSRVTLDAWHHLGVKDFEKLLPTL